MKVMSNKKSDRVNPLLTKSTNLTEPSHKNNISYDDLVLFEEILTAEVNKTLTNPDNIITKENVNATAKLIIRNLSQPQEQNWNPELDETIKIEEKSPRIEEKPTESVENDTKQIFDPQQLIERIRKSYERMQTIPNYELLTCRSQSFLQRLAVLGEMLT